MLNIIFVCGLLANIRSLNSLVKQTGQQRRLVAKTQKVHSVNLKVAFLVGETFRNSLKGLPQPCLDDEPCTKTCGKEFNYGNMSSCLPFISSFIVRNLSPQYN